MKFPETDFVLVIERAALKSTLDFEMARLSQVLGMPQSSGMASKGAVVVFTPLIQVVAL